MSTSHINRDQLKNELASVLTLARKLNLNDGPVDRVTIARGVDNWVVSDPDNVVSSFLPASKALGPTKTQAWRTLYNLREALWAVTAKHPHIVKSLNPGPVTLPVETTVGQLEPGDVFAYTPNPGNGNRCSPVLSVTDIGGQPTIHGDSLYPPGMVRVRYNDSDALGTLFYAEETVFRNNRMTHTS